MDLSSTVKNNKKNLTNIAYETIRDAIINSELKPGDHLNEPLLAKTLEMSRTPIREALKFLEKEGLVEHNGLGIFVKQTTSKEVYEIFAVRAALECEALSVALKNITDEELGQFENHWLSLRKRIENGQLVDFDIIAEYDEKFHSFITNKSNNTFLINILSGISHSMLRYQRLSAKSLGNEIDSIDQHLEIIKLMRGRDLDKISPVLYHHIKKGADNVSKIL